jgi:hypothetical protein
MSRQPLVPICLLVGALLLAPTAAPAADAWVSLTNQREPLYVHNLRIHYLRDIMGGEELVVMLPEQQKYTKYAFSDVRTVHVLGVAGFRYLRPSFKIRLTLMESAHWQDVLLMPVASLSGDVAGRPWQLRFESLDDEDIEKAELLKELRFVHE